MKSLTAKILLAILQAVLFGFVLGCVLVFLYLIEGAPANSTLCMTDTECERLFGVDEPERILPRPVASPRGIIKFS